MTEHLYIFHYTAPTIYHIKLEGDIECYDIETLFKEAGINEDECSWMYSDEELDIEHLGTFDNVKLIED